MKSIRVLAVDDEPLALERLDDLCRQIEGVEVVGSFQVAADAIKALPELRPELIFLDVEMPRIDGFDFIEALSRQTWFDAVNAPCICFSTAYPQFAPSAFDTGALDFLCKPIRLARLERTIERARRTLAERDALERLQELTGQLDALRESRNPRATAPSLWVLQRGQMVRIALEDLDWVGAEGEYVRLHCGEYSYLLRNSISSLADQLADDGFIRIHRSALINQARLSVLMSNRRGMKAVLSSGVQLTVGRKYKPLVRALQHATR